MKENQINNEKPITPFLFCLEKKEPASSGDLRLIPIRYVQSFLSGPRIECFFPLNNQRNH